MSFWYDELLTYYVARLPAFHAVWQAILAGADLNPPLFYVIQRITARIFGDGPVGLRIPEILGFWVFCICMFRFMAKERGLLAGWAAMCLPVFSGAYYYAYDARAYAIVLGFCGLALIAWQNLDENRNRTRWLAAFSFSLACAGLVHSLALLIAIPFALAELVLSIRARRIYWQFWIALGIPAIFTIISALPLLEGLRSLVHGDKVLYVGDYRPSFASLGHSYEQLLSPCIVFLLSALALVAVPHRGMSSRADTDARAEVRFRSSRLLLVLGFVLLPAIGLVFMKVAGSRFILRYFLSAIAGVSLAFGYAIARCRRTWLAASLVIALTLAMAGDFANVLRYRSAAWNAFPLQTGVSVTPNSSSGEPMAIHPLIASIQEESRPIATPAQMDFLYFVRYAPALVPRLYSVSIRTADLSYQENRAVREAGLTTYNQEQTFDEFLPAHTSFYLYGEPFAYTQLAYVLSRGGELKSLRQDGFGHFLAEIDMDAKQ